MSRGRGRGNDIVHGVNAPLNHLHHIKTSPNIIYEFCSKAPSDIAKALAPNLISTTAPTREHRLKVTAFCTDLAKLFEDYKKTAIIEQFQSCSDVFEILDKFREYTRQYQFSDANTKILKLSYDYGVFLISRQADMTKGIYKSVPVDKNVSNQEIIQGITLIVTGYKQWLDHDKAKEQQRQSQSKTAQERKVADDEKKNTGAASPKNEQSEQKAPKKKKRKNRRTHQQLSSTAIAPQENSELDEAREYYNKTIRPFLLKAQNELNYKLKPDDITTCLDIINHLHDKQQPIQREHPSITTYRAYSLYGIHGLIGMNGFPQYLGTELEGSKGIQPRDIFLANQLMEVNRPLFNKIKLETASHQSGQGVIEEKQSHTIARTARKQPARPSTPPPAKTKHYRPVKNQQKLSSGLLISTNFPAAIVHAAKQKEPLSAPLVRNAQLSPNSAKLSATSGILSASPTSEVKTPLAMIARPSPRSLSREEIKTSLLSTVSPSLRAAFPEEIKTPVSLSKIENTALVGSPRPLRTLPTALAQDKTASPRKNIVLPPGFVFVDPEVTTLIKASREKARQAIVSSLLKEKIISERNVSLSLVKSELRKNQSELEKHKYELQKEKMEKTLLSQAKWAQQIYIDTSNYITNCMQVDPYNTAIYMNQKDQLHIWHNQTTLLLNQHILDNRLNIPVQQLQQNSNQWQQYTNQLMQSNFIQVQPTQLAQLQQWQYYPTYTNNYYVPAEQLQHQYPTEQYLTTSVPSQQYQIAATESSNLKSVRNLPKPIQPVSIGPIINASSQIIRRSAKIISKSLPPSPNPSHTAKISIRSRSV